MDDLDNQLLLLAELTTCYKSVLESIDQNLPAISKALVNQYQVLMRGLRERFDRNPTTAVLQDVHPRLIEYLKTFCVQCNNVLDFKNKQFKEILRSFTEATTTLARQNAANDTRLVTFTRNLESIIDIPDLTEVRTRLVKEVAGLKQVVTQIDQSNQASVAQLRAQLSQFQEKLAYTEQMARTDSLTEVRNRRSAEEAVRLAIEDRERFSVVLLDLNGFKVINDRWGHAAGDEVLRQFAARLASAVRSGDVVCRWGGDEFLVLLPNCNLEQAMARSCEFRQICEGKYQITACSKPVSLWLRAAMGVAEWQLGEKFDALLVRTDQELYRAKGNSRITPDVRFVIQPAETHT